MCEILYFYKKVNYALFTLRSKRIDRKNQGIQCKCAVFYIKGNKMN